MLTLTLTTEQQFWRISRCPSGGQNEGIIYLQLCWMERVQHQVHGATATAGTTDGPLCQRHLSHHVAILSRQTDIFAYLTLLQVPHPDNLPLARLRLPWRDRLHRARLLPCHPQVQGEEMVERMRWDIEIGLHMRQSCREGR